MKLLLDTCTFLWVVAQPEKLSRAALESFQDPGNVCYLSSVSTWEIGVLAGLGRLQFQEPIDRYVPRMRRLQRIRPLRLLEAATLLVGNLATHHRDPFDRMLICQALAHELTIITPDSKIAQYSVPVIW